MAKGNTVLAIDVGHGHVKVVTRTGQGTITRLVFPSFAPKVSDARSTATLMADNLALVHVKLDGATYRAGSDIALAIPPGAQRNRDDQYARTGSYKALILAAMHMAKIREIDLLVVGLPMTTLAQNREFLKETLIGHHNVPAFNTGEARKGVTDKVEVKRVVVLAQAVGALMAAAEQVPDISDRRVLTLDLGWHTLDVMVSDGLRPFTERLGALQGGVAGYIDQIQKSVAAAIRTEQKALAGNLEVPADLYEKALRRTPGHRFVDLGPGSYDIDEHRQGADAYLRQLLSDTSSLIHNSLDVSSIVLAGGGASLLKELAREQFPSVARVIALNDPQYAIAHGFLLYGERRLAADQAELAHAR